MTLLLLLACQQPDAVDADLGCNGDPALCERRFDELVVPMTHNAMASAEEGFLGPNQNFGTRQQLSDGIRGFMLDTHADPDTGEAVLCHSVCALGSTPLVDGLRVFTDFFEANPRDVVVFMIQNGIGADETAAAFDEADLTRFAHAQDPDEPWPTLSELLDAGTPLIVFHEGGGTDPEWYMDGYDGYVWDTPYSAETAEDFSCDVLRGSPDSSLFLVNHFLTAPISMPSLAEQVNYNPLLIDRVRQCQDESGQQVNWISVDFYDIGDVVATARLLNEE